VKEFCVGDFEEEDDASQELFGGWRHVAELWFDWDRLRTLENIIRGCSRELAGDEPARN